MLPSSRKSNPAPNLDKHKASTKNTGTPVNSGLSQYVGFFAIGYLLTSVIFMIVQLQFALNPQLVTIISVFFGAYIAVHKFIKHQQRALSVSEMNRLTIGGTVVIWLLTALYFISLWLWLFDEANRAVFIEMSRQQPWPLVAALVMILVVTLVSARISILIVNRLLDPKRKKA